MFRDQGRTTRSREHNHSSGLNCLFMTVTWKKEILNSCVDLIPHTLVHFSEISCMRSRRERKQTPQAHFDLYSVSEGASQLVTSLSLICFRMWPLQGLLELTLHFVPSTWICFSKMKEYNLQQPCGKENEWTAAKAGTSLGGDWECNAGACISHLVLQPRSALLPTWFLSLQKKTRTFCCFQLWVAAERGKSARCLRGSWAAEFSNHASKSARDSDDILLQLVNAGVSSAALCRAGCAPSPAQDWAVSASQDPAQGEGIHCSREIIGMEPCR